MEKIKSCNSAGGPPLRAQIAIASYRYGLKDESGGDVVDTSLSGLLPAAGGPSNVQLADIETRSPVAGLYVRLERLLAQQVRLRAMCWSVSSFTRIYPRCRCGTSTLLHVIRTVTHARTGPSCGAACGGC